MKTEYTIDYFIEKFEAIPDNEIGLGGLSKQCALWHCGVRLNTFATEESAALIKVFGAPSEWMRSYVFKVNDDTEGRFPGKSPKERILNRLKLLKNGNNDQEKSIT
jgi:hypothetical protein